MFLYVSKRNLPLGLYMHSVILKHMNEYEGHFKKLWVIPKERTMSKILFPHAKEFLNSPRMFIQFL